MHNAINYGLISLESTHHWLEGMTLMGFRAMYDELDLPTPSLPWDKEFEAKKKGVKRDLQVKAKNRGVRITTRDNGLLHLDKSGLPQPLKGRSWRS